MHIIGLMIGVFVALSVWWWRAKVAKEAVDEIADAAGRLRGAYRRKKFRGKAEASTLTSIEDPAVGAAVLLVAIAEERAPLGEGETRRIATWLREVAERQDVDELIAFARWAVGQSNGFDQVLGRLQPLFRRALGPEQRGQLAEIAMALAADLDEAERNAVVRRLKSTLLAG